MIFFRHIGLLFKQLAAGGFFTLIVITVLGGVNAFYLANHDFTANEIVIALIGIITAIAFLKAAFIFAFYRILYRAPFEGSFFIIALLVTSLLIVALWAVSQLASVRIDGFPHAELPWLLMGVYVLISLVLFLVFRISQWVLSRFA